MPDQTMSHRSGRISSDVSALMSTGDYDLAPQKTKSHPSSRMRALISPAAISSINVASKTTPTPKVMDVTNQQNFDGSFSFTEALCQVIDISYDVAKTGKSCIIKNL
jgi:hypothetical protein